MRILLGTLLLLAMWSIAPSYAQWSSIDSILNGKSEAPLALDQSAAPILEDLPKALGERQADTQVMSDLQSISQALANRNKTYRAEHPKRQAWRVLPAPTAHSLTDTEFQYAVTAWRYFETTTDASTGLVRSTLKFPSTTMWDQGGYFLALVSAQRLGLITRQAAVERAESALTSLSQLPLNKGLFPNKAYNTQTLQMTDYANKVVPDGIGYSALDIMRLISGMLALEQAYPEVQLLSQTARQRWPLDQLVHRGRFYSTTTVGSRSKGLQQEGRIGYEQYAGRVGIQIGLNAWQAMAYAPILRWQDHEGIRIPGDRRLKHTHGVDPVTTSEPFILEALEFGWRSELQEVSSAVFLAQLHRFQTTGVLTSLSEDHIAGAPYFAYGGVLVGERPFETVTPGRKVVNKKRRISTKASFGWWVLTNHEYGTQLLEAIEDLQTDVGWQAGRFESDMSPNTIVTLNTNAVVLQALHFKAFGPIIRDAYAAHFEMEHGADK